MVAGRIYPLKIGDTELQDAIFKRSILQGRQDAFFDPTRDGSFRPADGERDPSTASEWRLAI
jgi:hypothetical protein